MTHSLEEASKSYTSLFEVFKRQLGKTIINLLWGMIITPLSNERKLIADHYLNMQEYLEHISDVKMPKDS